jgi:putative endonuclease
MSFHDRQWRGSVAHHAGRAAEDAVARHYQRAGCALAAERWRGKAGEVDLVLRDGPVWIFVEVKSGRDRDSAAARITPRQVRRIQMAALEFLGEKAEEAFPEMRFDAALVDRAGRIDVIENAFM